MLLSMPLNDVHASALRRSGSRPLHAYIKAPSPARLAATTYGFDPSSQQPPATPRLSSYPVGQGGVRPLLLPGRYAASAGAPTRPPAPGGGNGGASGEELELLWAGYSHMQEELRAMHAKCEALQHQLSSVTERLAEASRKQLAPSERWVGGCLCAWHEHDRMHAGMRMACSSAWRAPVHGVL